MTPYQGTFTNTYAKYSSETETSKDSDSCFPSIDTDHLFIITKILLHFDGNKVEDIFREFLQAYAKQGEACPDIYLSGFSFASLLKSEYPAYISMVLPSLDQRKILKEPLEFYIYLKNDELELSIEILQNVLLKIANKRFSNQIYIVNPRIIFTFYTQSETKLLGFADFLLPLNEALDPQSILFIDLAPISYLQNRDRALSHALGNLNPEVFTKENFLQLLERMTRGNRIDLNLAKLIDEETIAIAYDWITFLKKIDPLYAHMASMNLIFLSHNAQYKLDIPLLLDGLSSLPSPFQDMVGLLASNIIPIASFLSLLEICCVRKLQTNPSSETLSIFYDTDFFVLQCSQYTIQIPFSHSDCIKNLLGLPTEINQVFLLSFCKRFFPITSLRSGAQEVISLLHLSNPEFSKDIKKLFIIENPFLALLGMHLLPTSSLSPASKEALLLFSLYSLSKLLENDCMPFKQLAQKILELKATPEDSEWMRHEQILSTLIAAKKFPTATYFLSLLREKNALSSIDSLILALRGLNTLQDAPKLSAEIGRSVMYIFKFQSASLARSQLNFENDLIKLANYLMDNKKKQAAPILIHLHNYNSRNCYKTQYLNPNLYNTLFILLEQTDNPKIARTLISIFENQNVSSTLTTTQKGTLSKIKAAFAPWKEEERYRILLNKNDLISAKQLLLKAVGENVLKDRGLGLIEEIFNLKYKDKKIFDKEIIGMWFIEFNRLRKANIASINQFRWFVVNLPALSTIEWQNSKLLEKIVVRLESVCTNTSYEHALPFLLKLQDLQIPLPKDDNVPTFVFDALAIEAKAEYPKAEVLFSLFQKMHTPTTLYSLQMINTQNAILLYFAKCFQNNNHARLLYSVNLLILQLPNLNPVHSYLMPMLERMLNEDQLIESLNLIQRVVECHNTAINQYFPFFLSALQKLLNSQYRNVSYLNIIKTAKWINELTGNNRSQLENLIKDTTHEWINKKQGFIDQKEAILLLSLLPAYSTHLINSRPAIEKCIQLYDLFIENNSPEIIIIFTNLLRKIGFFTLNVEQSQLILKISKYLGNSNDAKSFCDFIKNFNFNVTRSISYKSSGEEPEKIREDRPVPESIDSPLSLELLDINNCIFSYLVLFLKKTSDHSEKKMLCEIIKTRYSNTYFLQFNGIFPWPSDYFDKALHQTYSTCTQLYSAANDNCLPANSYRQMIPYSLESIRENKSIRETVFLTGDQKELDVINGFDRIQIEFIEALLDVKLDHLAFFWIDEFLARPHDKSVWEDTINLLASLSIVESSLAISSLIRLTLMLKNLSIYIPEIKPIIDFLCYCSNNAEEKLLAAQLFEYYFEEKSLFQSREKLGIAILNNILPFYEEHHRKLFDSLFYLVRELQINDYRNCQFSENIYTYSYSLSKVKYFLIINIPNKFVELMYEIEFFIRHINDDFPFKTTNLDFLENILDLLYKVTLLREDGVIKYAEITERILIIILSFLTNENPHQKQKEKNIKLQASEELLKLFINKIVTIACNAKSNIKFHILLATLICKRVKSFLSLDIQKMSSKDILLPSVEPQIQNFARCILSNSNRKNVCNKIQVCIKELHTTAQKIGFTEFVSTKDTYEKDFIGNLLVIRQKIIIFQIEHKQNTNQTALAIETNVDDFIHNLKNQTSTYSLFIEILDLAISLIEEHQSEHVELFFHFLIRELAIRISLIFSNVPTAIQHITLYYTKLLSIYQIKNDRNNHVGVNLWVETLLYPFIQIDFLSISKVFNEDIMESLINLLKNLIEIGLFCEIPLFPMAFLFRIDSERIIDLSIITEIKNMIIDNLVSEEKALYGPYFNLFLASYKIKTFNLAINTFGLKDTTNIMRVSSMIFASNLEKFPLSYIPENEILPDPQNQCFLNDVLSKPLTYFLFEHPKKPLYTEKNKEQDTQSL